MVPSPSTNASINESVAFITEAIYSVKTVGHTFVTSNGNKISKS